MSEKGIVMPGFEGSSPYVLAFSKHPIPGPDIVAKLEGNKLANLFVRHATEELPLESELPDNDIIIRLGRGVAVALKFGRIEEGNDDQNREP